MRLHHLRVTAFGPFAGTVEVDLDDLAESGLFLLSGPTGAGKTSVLDAVCFALYGDVPGDRAQARRLRCDRAAADAVPRVELEATVGGRLLRLARSPSWERPKRRGTGTTRQQASVTVSERVDGEWRPLTSRLDEAGHLVAGLLGMTLTQFTQVALLPQGRFQAFLRARSEERHQLLGRLFRTGRFEDVERWLRERRTDLRRRSEGHQRAVADLLSRISETTGEPLPTSWTAAEAGGGPADGLDLAGPAADGRVLGWAEALAADTAVASQAAAAAAAAAAEAEESARRTAEAARVLRDQQARLARAREEVARLEEVAAEHAGRVQELDGARRSAPVVPLHAQARAARDAATRAEQQAAEAVGEVAALLDALVVDRDEVVRLESEAERAAAGLRTALSRSERLTEVRRRALAAAARRGDLVDEATALSEERASVPARLAALEAACDRARAAAADCAVLDVRVEEAERRLRAAEDAVAVAAGLARARADWLDARQAALRHHEDLLAVREARVSGMAAEIAAGLAVGACCPVCGSEDHPHKAASSPDAPDAKVEREAQRLLDDARADEHARDMAVRDLVTRLDLALERAGAPMTDALDQGSADAPSPGELAVRLLAEREELRAAREERGLLARDAPVLVDRLAAARRAAESAAERQAAAEAAVAATDRTLEELREEEDELAAELRLLLAGSPVGQPAVDDVDAGHAALTALLARHLSTAATCRAAEQRLAAAATAEEAARSAAAAVTAALTEARFDGLDDALAASRPPGRVAELADAVAAHERRTAAVRAVLDDPALDAARELQPGDLPDLAMLDRVHADARDALGVAREEAAAGSTCHARLERLVDDLRAALHRWGPVRSELATTAGLAAFVEGRSPDNRLQMRLSAYVLAHRLSQVVAAANERLARMTAGRYALEHTGRRGAGETRGGLSLLVRDDWSGEPRDPATLSGGETFVVSLALALGLADVIAQESGGAELDTLFVDEGFGSLDAETLDEVMDVLDGLRDGGRVVGVVSHVAEMRDRIPTRLEVTKGRAGSTLRTVRG